MTSACCGRAVALGLLNAAVIDVPRTPEHDLQGLS